MSQQYASLKAIIPLLLVVFIDSLGMALIFPILTPVFMSSDGILPLATSDNIRSLLYGLTLCAFPIAMFFGTPILGNLSDYIGRKRILLLCLAGVASSYFLSSLAIIIESITLLIISRIIAGLFAGSIATAQAAVIDISDPEKKAANLSLMLFPSAIGFVAGPLLGSFTSDSTILSWFGLWTPLAIGCIFALLNILFLWFGFNETHEAKPGFIFKWNDSIKIFADAFRTPIIRKLSIIYVCLQLSWSLYFQYISLFLLHQYNYSSSHIGLFMAILGLGFATALLYLVKIFTKHFENKLIVFYSFLLSTLCLFATVFIYNGFLAWIFGFILATAMAITYPVIISMYSDMIGLEKQGWIMGVANAVVGFAWAITAISGGFMQTISNDCALIIAGVLMLTATVLIYFYRTK